MDNRAILIGAGPGAKGKATEVRSCAVDVRQASGSSDQGRDAEASRGREGGHAPAFASPIKLACGFRVVMSDMLHQLIVDPENSP
jgi:hypothetical protein